MSETSLPAEPPRRRRILLLAPFPPRLDGTHGGSRAIAQLAVALSARNAVCLAHLRARDEPSVDPDLARHCERVVEGERGGSSRSSVFPLTPSTVSTVVSRLLAGDPLWVAGRYSPAFDARVRDIVRQWRPDVVQAEFAVMGQYVSARSDDDTSRVVTFHEPAAAAAHERATSSGSTAAFWRWESGRWRRLERALLSRVHSAVVFTDRDADSLRALRSDAGGASIDVLPLGVAIPTVPAPSETSARVVFVGNFAHPPNADAARYLIDEIFPPPRRAMPALELRIVGPNAPRSLTDRAASGVTITGEVPDVGAELAAAQVVVAPLRYGGGTRVKVLEAMAVGKAIVATSRAVAGIDATHGVELLVADDAESFRRCVRELLDDPSRRSALGAAARARVERDHSWERMAAGYEAIYDRIARERSADLRVATRV